MKVDVFGEEFQALRVNERLEAEKRQLLPEEFQAFAKDIVIKGESMSKKIVQAQPPIPTGEKATVTVVSSVEDPITRLQDLLLYLMNGRTVIHLQLLDTFFNGNSSSADDSIRLKLFLHRNFGAHLASFYGHLTHAAWAKFGVVGLPKLGLHLQSGADVADVNKILHDNCSAENVKPAPGEHSSSDGASTLVTGEPFIADIAINKSINVKDIVRSLEQKTNRLYRLHLVKLEDRDWKRCSRVVRRLLQNQKFDGGAWNPELWIHDCSGLSADVMAQVRRYLCDYTTIDTLRMNNHSMEEAQQQQMAAKYPQYITIHFSIPSF
ncbi:uncharacterized protein LOC108667663 [Hyalella azteca]|uniref:Uncharacterized protein LOC108667663 n=1 Tax=Hyalella azteca TaxID=294128 RepID=A0A8B7N962_HYAAZ|nr:uncharacterized protein LOC108667663 [Hyalella azteca]XP_018010196.1 uncharacterized protein LOC108667663 [Hyalella azteca]